MFIEPFLLGATVAGTASVLSLKHHYKQMLGPMTVREVRQLARLAPTPIAQATSGFVKFVGTVGASAPVTSYYHRTPCAIVELHHYEVRDSASGPRRMLVETERRVQPFWIEDETGRVAIDPSFARIDYEIEGEDLESTIEEHRLRIGERAVVLGTVTRTGPQLTQPMRKASTNFEQGLAFVSPPLVTWRSEPEVFPRLLPPFGGLALSAGSICIAVLGAVLEHGR